MSMNKFLIILLIQIVCLPVASVLVLAQDQEDISLANEYHIQGDVEKALSLYEKLARRMENIPMIHDNYFKLMINTGRTDMATKYIDRIIDKFPGNLNYRIDKGMIYRERNDAQGEAAYFKQLIESIAKDPFKVRIAAQHMSRNQLTEYALQTYQAGREASGNPDMFSIQMASIYRVLNQKDRMIQEYLNYVNEHPKNLAAVKNILQSILNDEEDLDAFEMLMIDKVQKSPNNPMYVDLLIWVNLQKKDFYAAFIQARAIDKRKKLNGTNVMEIGRIALNNRDYRNAIRVFEYIIDTYPGSPNYEIAKRMLIQSREELVKISFPVDTTEIRALIADYEQLVREVGINNNTIEAMRSKALLHAFYLDEYEISTEIFNMITSVPRINQTVINQSKLDLGDIYLLMGQPWESTLLYSQVEKAAKDTPLGYEAKLKNAKLSYYKGDFALAQNHLDILKLATTREISNDAIALSLLIKDNTLLDSNDVAMQRFAEIDLLIFQNKKRNAIAALDSMLLDFPAHSLTDEILWRSANLKLELGRFDAAVEFLERIDRDFGFDILGDDAKYLMGIIFEEHKADIDKAMEIYNKFLTKYPGSNYAADVRKRFRVLRGDFL
jgi:tetratricopeptide (TPR) repeat protein